MKYVLKCPSCAKKAKLSDRNADKYQDEKGIVYEWDCPHCKYPIAAQFWGRHR